MAAIKMEASLPNSVYTILGVIILTNLGVILTVIGFSFKMVYRAAVVETTLAALHRRVDKLDDNKYDSEEEH